MRESEWEESSLGTNRFCKRICKLKHSLVYEKNPIGHTHSQPAKDFFLLLGKLIIQKLCRNPWKTISSSMRTCTWTQMLENFVPGFIETSLFFKIPNGAWVWTVGWKSSVQNLFSTFYRTLGFGICVRNWREITSRAQASWAPLPSFF